MHCRNPLKSRVHFFIEKEFIMDSYNAGRNPLKSRVHFFLLSDKFKALELFLS